MLLLTSIVSWAGWPERTGAAVINTHCLSACRTVNVNDTAGFYSLRNGHSRGDFRYMQIDSTLAATIVASDIAPAMTFNDFLVYPNNDETQVPVTMYFKTADIRLAYLQPGSISRSFLVVLENGIKLTRYLVDSSLKDIVNEATTGSTSNL